MKGVDPGADYDVQLTLELARVAREPTLADKQRVLEELQLRLGELPGLSSVGESTTGVRRVIPKLAPPTLTEQAARMARSLVSSKLAPHLIWVGAVTGALGFWVGTRNTEPSPIPGPDARAGSLVAPWVSSEAPPYPPPKAAEQPGPKAPNTAPRALETPKALQPETAQLEPKNRRHERWRVALLEPPATAATPSATTGARAAAPVLAPTPRRAHDQKPAHLGDNARFFEAVRLLQRAQRALDAGEPSLALALLAELDERFPRDLLSEERDAARVVGLCKSGDTQGASRLAQELASMSPSSIYAARITRSCGALDLATKGQP
jgi:hypothetical protein